MTAYPLVPSPPPDGSRIRVLFLDNSFRFGGAIISLADLVRQLPSEGIDPVVMSGQPPDVLARLFPAVPWLSVRWPLSWVDSDPFIGKSGERNVESLHPVARLMRSAYWMVRGELRPALQIRRVARLHHTHLIHLNNNAESQAAGSIAAKLLAVPCVAHKRGKPSPADRSIRLRLALPDLHIGISTAVSEGLLANGVSADRLRTIHNPVDLEGFSPGPPPAALRESLGIPVGRQVVGLFGRIVPFKGVLEFVRAFKLVADRIPEATALIVGDRSDGPAEYEAAVHRLVADLELTERVVMTGFRDDVASLYRLCDVLTLTSLGEEGFGRVLVEAMATGVPVVASASGGPLDIVRDSIDGFLRDPRDPAAFASAIISIFTDDGMQARMGKMARARAVDAFSSPSHARQVADAYRDLLSSRRR